VSPIPPQLAEALGERYRLERELGHGGMGAVYLAEDLKHHRKIAIKVLHPALAASVGPERFLREIEVAAHLQHPGILPLHDSGQAGEYLYYIMPYVEGESLRDRLARDSELPIQEAVKLLSEVLDALAYAHSKGVVHRDIKPDNVMLSSHHALVTDFGVAKALGDSAGPGFVTTAGLALGTPSYMAPEQALAGREIDYRADLYAVGVMGYELLTGRLPFVGGNPQQVVAAHLTLPPEEVTTHRSAIPPQLARVIMRALEKRPADRWQSAAEMQARLEPLLSPAPETMPTAPAATPGSRTRPRLIWPVVGGLLTCSAALLVLFSRRPDSEIGFGRRVQLTLDPGLEIDPAISPDGRFVAYAAGAMPALEIRVRQVDGGAAIALATQVGRPQRFPSWSADGKRIMFRSPRGIEIAPALGGAANLLVPDEQAGSPGGGDPWGSSGFLMPVTWSPDGERVAYVRSDSLYALSLDDARTRLLAQGGEMHSCSWSPNGGWIACVRGNRQSQQPSFFFGNKGQGSIWVIPVAGGAPVQITDNGSYHASPTWVPGARGAALLFLSNQDGGLDAYRVGLRPGGQPEGPARRLTTGLNAQSISLSADGRRLAYSVFTESSNVWSLPIPATAAAPSSVRQAEPVTSGNQVTEGFDVSPDGRWLAFDSDRSGNADLYRQPLGGGEPEQLTTDPADDFWPNWSPDGREIVFHAFREGRRHLFIMSSDGRERQQITFGADDERTGEWSPDGRTLYFLRNFNGPGSEVRSISRDKSGRWEPARRVYRGNTLPVVVSPDGRLVAFATGGAVWAMGPTGESPHILVPRSDRPEDPQATYLSWSEDGRTLYYLGVNAAGLVSIWSVGKSGGPSRLLVRFDDPTREWHRFGFSAHGGRFYFTLGDRESDIWTAEVAKATR
jgi:Tol biopolymer transport system component